MEDKKITPQELKAAWSKDMDRLAEQVAEAINNAQPGNIIDDSEEPVVGTDETEEPVAEAEEIDETGLDEQGFSDVDDDFRPSEEIPADQSIPFPADI